MHTGLQGLSSQAAIATMGHHVSMATGSSLSMATVSQSADHMLAKPVPMRRLSEKRIAQARACLSTVTMAPETGIIGNPSLSKSDLATLWIYIYIYSQNTQHGKVPTACDNVTHVFTCSSMKCTF